jgi:hypothetical protein
MSNSKPLPWADGGQRLIDAGYDALPVELSQIEFGRLYPDGPFAFGMNLAALGNHDRYATGVLAARLPIEGASIDECRARWCAGIRIEASDATVGDALEDMVRRMAGAGPVQLSDNSPSRLHVFRIEATDARHFTMTTQPYSAGTLSVEAPGAYWLHEGAGLRWKDGVDLLTVRRQDLPLLTPEAAQEIMRAADEGFAKLQPPPPKTALQLRMEARVAHRLACGVCASCQDAKPGDWVALHDLSWPACRIVSVDAATGEFQIEHEGKPYRAPGHRLFPTAAPVVAEKPFEGELLIGGFHRTSLATRKTAS